MRSIISHTRSRTFFFQREYVKIIVLFDFTKGSAGDITLC